MPQGCWSSWKSLGATWPRSTERKNRALEMRSYMLTEPHVRRFLVPPALTSGRATEPTVLHPQSSLIFLEVQTVKMNCKETLLSNCSLLIDLPLTLCRNTCLLFSLLDRFTQAFLPPEMSFLTPLPVQSLLCFKTYLSSAS